MQKQRIAINGFGRIGRSAFKIAFEKKDIEIVALNDLTSVDILAHLLKYDTAYGQYRKRIEVSEGKLIVDGKECLVFAEPDPKKLPWKELAIDVVLECTGRFTDSVSASQHIAAGAKKVILSAPAKTGDVVPSILVGVNESSYQSEEVISNASCTTNSLAPVAKIIHEEFGIAKALMTTIHSYTADQNLQDGPHKDLRRARAAASNIVPTTTGAAIAVTQVIPELSGLFDGLSLRVPTIVVSLTDFTFVLKKKTTVEEINAVLERASQDARYRQVLAVTREPLVSSDFIGDPHSSTIDLSLTKVIDGDLVKIVAWYDNEWGYSNRLVELVTVIGKQ
ncbi:MAG: type I glyceraldehyde-3-phosphate dehydrogenase [Candidatus Moranbacteria bacterium]|nr:type I glyceraldehyde-3-phosphate dehydrogenase [Candidatus Moranbacteria bacterium]MDD3965131.1 type I glyceraldehyde-3-phosphate dehydrogenase [Candidatus Moranbacteria bacterium]